MAFALLSVMTTIRFVCLPEGIRDGRSGGWAVAGIAPLEGITLRFGLEASDPQALDAILHARRSMLREEWTRGNDADEPRLQDAVFSPAEIVWKVRPEQRCRCLQKVEELETRVRRWLAEREGAVAT